MRLYYLINSLLSSSNNKKFLCLSSSKSMSTSIPDPKEWNPPGKIEELFAASAGNKFAAINSPVAGARSEKDLPTGPASVQLYSLATPNGISNLIFV